MFSKLNEIVTEYEDLTNRLSQQEVLRDPRQLKELGKRKSDLQEIVELYKSYVRVEQELEDTEKLINESEKDAEMVELAQSEHHQLLSTRENIKESLQKLLLPRDARDAKNVILEVRAGTGGEEAALFAGDLFRMYSKFAEANRWHIDILSSHETGVGGFKEIIVSISGRQVYSRLKYEGGVHRVQRVPQTETQGRIHTSAVTVAVLPEAEDVEIHIDENNDLRIDVFRSSGPGGQSVNTTDSAVRITHLPTGIVVTCQDEKSQHKNKSKALKILRARLLDHAEQEQRDKISEERRKMVSTGDRSAKIRTYNFPQSRVTDHRIGLTLYRLDAVLDGDLGEIIDSLTAFYQAESLKTNALS